MEFIAYVKRQCWRGLAQLHFGTGQGFAWHCAAAAWASCSFVVWSSCCGVSGLSALSFKGGDFFLS